MFLGRQTRLRVAALSLVALTAAACAGSDNADSAAQTPQADTVESTVESTVGEDGSSTPNTGWTDPMPGTGDGSVPGVNGGTDSAAGNEPVTVVIPASVADGNELDGILEIILSPAPEDQLLVGDEPIELSEACSAALSELNLETTEGTDGNEAGVIDDSQIPDACIDEFLNDPRNIEIEFEMPELVSGDDGSLSFTITQNELDRALRNTRNYITGETQFYQTISEISFDRDVSDIRIAVDMPAHTASDETGTPYGTHLYAKIYRALVGKSANDYLISITVVDQATGDIVETYREEINVFLVPDSDN